MTIKARMIWIILPALFVVGVGILEINFPYAMKGFDDGYTGRGSAGFILMLFEFFLMLTWGKIEGIILILLGMIPIVFCFSPSSNNKSNDNHILFSPLAFETAKFVWKRRNKTPVEKQQQIINVAKKLSKPETRQLINQTATKLTQQYLQRNVVNNSADSKDEQPELQEETSETEKLTSETEAKPERKSRLLGKTARSLAKKYLEDNKQ